MNDKELLEFAAKAAGYSTEPYSDGEYMGANRYEYTEGPSAWNPLTDDGDALRLAVKLGLWEAVQDGYQHLDSDGDIGAATRRSIVRAAAKIGKSL
jgi:hypothetical protein